MTNLEHTLPDAVLVAIDVSKIRNDVLIEIPGTHRRRRLIVPNTRLEHDRFVDRLLALSRPVMAGFEATGNYHRPLAYRLLQAGISLRLVSSVALARTREALHNGWDKNDPKDAQVILHMLKIGATQTYCDPICSGINDIQELSKTHEVVSQAKTELWHRLSYDPNVLAKLGVVGMAADVEKARSWYRKAESFGSAEASRRLNALANR
jgi:hypothetical protein